jgi:uncharacterized damage-inducible protein DinB
MNANRYRRLYDYNYWAHRRVWECVAPLTEEQFIRPSNYSIGSIHEQVVHTMAAEWLFLQRVQGISPDSLPQADQYPTRESIRAEWDQLEAGWRAYVAKLSDEQLDGLMTFTSLNGKTSRTMPLWEMLSQILNHSTDHRAQTLALIHQVGGKTVEQDFIFYAWEKPQ